HEQDFVRMHDEFNKLLLHEARSGRRMIIVVDEAQNLHPSVLETIRLLSDFETPKAKLLQIILAGQPELADKLAGRRLSQLRQRISLLSGLSPLSVAESSNYIEHRLRIAGYSGAPLFAPEALQAIAQFTEGIPRSINNFCFNALSLGCALRERVVSAAMVDEVISDLDITKHITELPRSASESKFLEAASNGKRPPLRGISYSGDGDDPLTSAQAKAYMQQLAVQLRNWKREVD
ncbi:MAG: AAA family ATPase, partial [Candidatus Sulfotelmatobacter sp.]